MQQKYQRLVSTKELAQYLGSTENSIRSLKSQGKIPSQWTVNIGRSVRYDLQEVDKWIESKKEANKTNILTGWSI